MGLLSEGRPLKWTEIKDALKQIRTYGVDQLIQVYHKCKNRQRDAFTWGDEVELTLVRFDHENKKVQLLLKAHKLLPALHKLNEEIQDEACRIAWHPEACDFVVEGVPFQPYGFLPSHFNTVEANMRLRREQVQKLLAEQSDCDFILNIAAFPRYGQGEYTHPAIEYGSSHSVEESLCFPDSLISPIHPRTKSLSENTHERRQGKASVNIPIFKDSSTPSPFRDNLFKDDPNLKDDHIHLDSTAAGWGCCCLQVTFQAESFEGSLRLYDQLIPLCPIMLCLSAACPIWRGYLSDVDCRWNIISAAADDRTAVERQQENILSRYGPTPFYLTDEKRHLNDLDFPVCDDVVQKLISQGIPETLSRHFGHLFVRDPLVIIEEFLHPKDDSNSYHFENLNSLVWNTLRLKPPPLDDDLMGWRVEFRPMDIQMTDFGNAALTVFVALMTRVILTYNLDFAIPISQVNENMNRAHHRDSARQEKFYFRCGNEISEMYMNEIINGNNDFPGLVPLTRQYIGEREDIDADTRFTIEQYLLLVSKRAAGTLMTNASWIRQFVLSHASYKQDSVVTEEIQYDLVRKMEQISNGHEDCPQIRQSNMETHTDLHAE
ncbi:unnamed protein product [Adineta ricciae]|uniref:Glutamate--cysteine ligase n=1 Tax=Adineta ricciae TaxID=249248 RepID=A0A814Q7A3_ADIRI|nr:unnamed protein product [Adineta ricciae]CAF1372168.1 unnamed protein product [Adineta ricciae]